MRYQGMERYGEDIKCILLSERSQSKKAIYTVWFQMYHNWEETKVGNINGNSVVLA